MYFFLEGHKSYFKILFGTKQHQIDYPHCGTDHCGPRGVSHIRHVNSSVTGLARLSTFGGQKAHAEQQIMCVNL